MTKKRIESDFNSAARVSLEDLQTATDILAKLDTQVKSLNKAFDKVDTRIDADALDVKNNIASVSNYVHWIGLTLIHNIPNEETPLTLLAKGPTSMQTIKLSIESKEK